MVFSRAIFINAAAPHFAQVTREKQDWKCALLGRRRAQGAQANRSPVETTTFGAQGAPRGAQGGVQTGPSVQNGEMGVPRGPFKIKQNETEHGKSESENSI